MTAAIRLASGSMEVEVLPADGARLHSLRVLGHDLLRTPTDVTLHRADPFFWGGYHMAPWCNRIAASPVTVGGRTVTPRPNFTDGTAIHGRVYGAPATVLGNGRFGFDDAGDDAWPWAYRLEVEFAVDDATLRLRQRLVNRSADAMPAGVGFHPWFRRPLEVAINAGEVFASNFDSPARPEAVAGTLDQRQLRALPSGVDATWAGVADPPVRLKWPGAGVAATIHFAAPSRYVVAASPVALDADAVEIQTHAPDGLRRLLHGEAGALTMLEPGVALELTMVMEFRAIAQEVTQ